MIILFVGDWKYARIDLYQGKEMEKKELNKYIKLLPNGDWKKEQLLVYRYNSMLYIGLFLLCFGFGLFMLVGAIINLTSNGLELGLVLLFGGAIFMTFGVVFWLFINRCVLIFYSDGLVYRNLRGEVFAIADEDVLYVVSLGGGKNRCFQIETREKTITWSIHARHFFEAEKSAFDRYPDMDTFKVKKEL
mgnify:CR=1 FL=1